jgi:hypothetical protein
MAMTVITTSRSMRLKALGTVKRHFSRRIVEQADGAADPKLQAKPGSRFRSDATARVPDASYGYPPPKISKPLL